NGCALKSTRRGRPGCHPTSERGSGVLRYPSSKDARSAARFRIGSTASTAPGGSGRELPMLSAEPGRPDSSSPAAASARAALSGLALGVAVAALACPPHLFQDRAAIRRGESRVARGLERRYPANLFIWLKGEQDLAGRRAGGG